MRTEPHLCSLTDRWSSPHSQGLTEPAPRSTVQACGHHFYQSSLLLVTPVSLYSTYWWWGQSRGHPPTSIPQGGNEQSGRKNGLDEYSAVCPSPVVLSITLPFLMSKFGGQHMNPGLIPPEYSQTGEMQRQAGAAWLEAGTHTHTPSHTHPGWAVSVTGLTWPAWHQGTTSKEGRGGLGNSPGMWLTFLPVFSPTRLYLPPLW